ncbi:MAG TPA: aminotransferase class I/II-fold pyridoxal phosphate-dependent enzyme, partial [Flavitalea sp.]|nr:aminotransferase class I/II-fold pyridoxal phosphate-dependent enzyme [Flavitalea sp.]
EFELCRHGSTGSRLLAGNYPLIEETERQIASFHEAEAGLIFNSGYDANVGLLSCVPQRGDTILYDYLSHASIRDGIRLSFARSISFEHNNVEDLRSRIAQASGNIFVVTESVFSMDGDIAPIKQIVDICKASGAHLIVDEAHATGLVGERGEGLVQQQGCQSQSFARVHTFGKAVGCHGAIVLGSNSLRNYLINFSRPFIYSTSLPESSIWAIKRAYELFPRMHSERSHLKSLVARFQDCDTSYRKAISNTAIQAVIVPGNDCVRELANKLQVSNLDVRPILYPTVPKGSERLRIVLHAFNTASELEKLLETLGSSKSEASIT